jgi:hypothetical protein
MGSSLCVSKEPLLTFSGGLPEAVSERGVQRSFACAQDDKILGRAADTFGPWRVLRHGVFSVTVCVAAITAFVFASSLLLSICLKIRGGMDSGSGEDAEGEECL